MVYLKETVCGKLVSHVLRCAQQGAFCGVRKLVADLSWMSVLRADFLEAGKSRFLGPGNPDFGGPTNGKIKILKIQIRSAQNVGKVWISSKKILPALFGAI